MLITPRTSAIFWGTVARSGNAGRIGFSLDGRLGFLDRDYVFPVIAEVVGIAEAGDAGFHQAIQGQATLISDVVDGVPIAILPAIDLESMEMAVVPAHRRLDRVMQVA